MAKILNISIADAVMDKINHLIIENGISNKSEMVEEFIRLGIDQFEKAKKIIEKKGE